MLKILKIDGALHNTVLELSWYDDRLFLSMMMDLEIGESKIGLYPMMVLPAFINTQDAMVINNL
jgi:hypothetical protein